MDVIRDSCGWVTVRGSTTHQILAPVQNLVEAKEACGLQCVTVLERAIAGDSQYGALNDGSVPPWTMDLAGPDRLHMRLCRGQPVPGSFNDATKAALTAHRQEFLDPGVADAIHFDRLMISEPFDLDGPMAKRSQTPPSFDSVMSAAYTSSEPRWLVDSLNQFYKASDWILPNQGFIVRPGGQFRLITATWLVQGVQQQLRSAFTRYPIAARAYDGPARPEHIQQDRRMRDAVVGALAEGPMSISDPFDTTPDIELGTGYATLQDAARVSLDGVFIVYGGKVYNAPSESRAGDPAPNSAGRYRLLVPSMMLDLANRTGQMGPLGALGWTPYQPATTSATVTVRGDDDRPPVKQGGPSRDSDRQSWMAAMLQGPTSITEPFDTTPDLQLGPGYATLQEAAVAADSPVFVLYMGKVHILHEQPDPKFTLSSTGRYRLILPTMFMSERGKVWSNWKVQPYQPNPDPKLKPDDAANSNGTVMLAVAVVAGLGLMVAMSD